MKTAEPAPRDEFAAAKFSGWRTPSKCPTGACVEVGQSMAGFYALRDTKLSHLGSTQPQIVLHERAYATFLDELLGLLPAGSNGEITAQQQDDGDWIFRSVPESVELRYDIHEIDAFIAGIKAGELHTSLTKA